MSTKSSIISGENFHLYDELIDGGVYLEINHTENASIEIIEGQAVVRIRLPKVLIERLKVDGIQLVEPSNMFDDDSVLNINNGKK